MAHEHGGKSSSMMIDVKKAIGALVRKNDVFLDVGAGPGDYLLAASGLTKNLIGLDKHKPSILRMKERGFEAIEADAERKIPLKSGSVDSVLLSNVLHGFEDKDAALKEIARVLKKGGRFGVIEFRKRSLFGPPSEITKMRH